MDPLKSDDIFGNWATLLLPIGENDQIDYKLLNDEIDFLISSQVNGIYSNGTAGELYNQTEKEFDRIQLMLAAKCQAAKMPFQIGCSHPDPGVSRARLKRITYLCPSAVQVIVPDWTAPSMAEVIGFLREMSALAAPIGLVLYNPPHAKKRLGPVEFGQIMQAGIPLVGCKTGGGDQAWFEKMKNTVPGLSIFVPGHHLATGIGLGASGAYSNVACLHPAAAQQWYEMMREDMGRALELEGRIQRFMRDYIVPYIEDGYANQAVDKFLAVIGGWSGIGTRLRWPYQGIPSKETVRIRKIAMEILPEFFKFGAR